MSPPDSTGWFIVLWLTVIGGVVGSFLNVVIYRLPLGLSLINPPSHCPTCKKHIPLYDNVPVFGWIILRGRCRSCQSRISFRYPLVEAVTAAMFGVLAAVMHYSHGANLPSRPLEIAEGMTLIGIDGWQLYGIYLFHLWLLCTLLCAALIEFDGKQPPLSLFIPAFILGGLAPLFLPLLRPVAAWPGMPYYMAGAIDSLCGAAAGGLLAGSVWSARKLFGKLHANNEQRPVGLYYCLLCVGLFLGWQAVLALAIGTAAIYLITWPIRRLWPVASLPASMWLLPLTFAWILGWSRLVDLWPKC